MAKEGGSERERQRHCCRIISREYTGSEEKRDNKHAARRVTVGRVNRGTGSEGDRGRGGRSGEETTGRLMVHLSSWQRRFAAHLLLHRHSSALGGGPLAASAGIRTRVTIHRVGQRASRRLLSDGRAFARWRRDLSASSKIRGRSSLFSFFFFSNDTGGKREKVSRA